MAALTLTFQEYRDRVFGGWQGKSAGVTLGATQRGQMSPGRFNYYTPVPGQPAASIALDFPLVWLDTLENTGPDVAPEDLAVAWLEHLDYSQDEFAYAALNLRRGLPPPASGTHSNWFKHGTGGVMRADFWAMIAPGSPQTAAAYAYHDAKIDHCEDGIWAAMFLAALGSAAFFLTDPVVLLTIGLAMMPRTCRSARAVKTVIAAWQRAASWLEAREVVLNEVGSKNYTDVPQNLGFFAIGLLYGRGDFGGALCAGVNCGYDSEAIGGALGAVVGMMQGQGRLPAQWVQPIGDLFIPGTGLLDLDAPQTLTELTDRTVALGRKVTAARCPDVALVESLEGGASMNARAAFLEFHEPSSGTPHPAAAPQSTPPASAIPGGILSAGSLPPLASEAPSGPTTSNPSSVAPSLPPDLTSAPAGSPAVPASEPAPESAPATATPPGLAPASPTVPESLAASSAPTSGQAASAPTAETQTEPPQANGSATLAAWAGAFMPQPVSEAEPPVEPPAEPPVAEAPGSAFQPPSAVEPAPVQVPIIPPAPDLTNAIAWADSALVKPLLVTPSSALVGQAGSFTVVMDTHDSPTISMNQIKRLSFTIYNHSHTAFSGRLTLLAPPGWQIGAPANIGQRQYIAPNTGILRIEYTLRATEGQARIEIANAVNLRFSPDDGSPSSSAEFVLLGASCWWTVGPFANFDGEGFDRSYLPEDRPGLNESYLSRSMQMVQWERQTYPESVLDLEPLFRSSSGVCYGQTVLRSPTSRDARLVVNSNSGVKLWLNGALVFRRFYREAFRPVLGSGLWAVDVSLHAGDNPIMTKWVRGSEPYAFSLTVSDRLGRGLPEVSSTSW